MKHRIDRDEKGVLDDIGIENVDMFRFESLSDNEIWIRLIFNDDRKDLVIDLSSNKKINITDYEE